MRTFVLLVTWFVSHQPPSSYQTTFQSAEACETARTAVLAEGRRIKAEFEQRSIQATGDTFFAITAPTVTAVCVDQ